MARSKDPKLAKNAVFLDRDGVINQYCSNYVRTLSDFEYYDFTEKAFRALGIMGIPIVVITNQSAIGRGYCSEQDVLDCHDKLMADAESWGAPISLIEYCPHTPQEACRCRKPHTGLVDRAAKKLGIDVTSSYLVGDAPSDIQLGKKLSMVTLRVATGRGGEESPSYAQPAWPVENLLAAATKIAQLEGFIE